MFILMQWLLWHTNKLLLDLKAFELSSLLIHTILDHMAKWKGQLGNYLN